MSAPRYPPSRFRLVAGRREKLCGGCGRWFVYTREHWYRNGSKPDGLDGQCKSCKGAKMRAQSHRIRVAQTQARQYARWSMGMAA